MTSDEIKKNFPFFYAALGLQYPDGLSPEHAAACWLREIAYLAQLRKGAGGVEPC